jgi:hypothetical protein
VVRRWRRAIWIGGPLEEWRLEIPCSRCLGNWDRFCYPPEPGDERRPDSDLINGWAYYHE